MIIKVEKITTEEDEEHDREFSCSGQRWRPGDLVRLVPRHIHLLPTLPSSRPPHTNVTNVASFPLLWLPFVGSFWFQVWLHLFLLFSRMCWYASTPYSCAQCSHSDALRRLFSISLSSFFRALCLSSSFETVGNNSMFFLYLCLLSTR